MYRIYTLLDSQRFYFNRNNDTFGVSALSYEYEGIDLLTCNLIEATAKAYDMRVALAAIELSYNFDIFYEFD